MCVHAPGRARVRIALVAFIGGAAPKVGASARIIILEICVKHSAGGAVLSFRASAAHAR